MPGDDPPGSEPSVLVVVDALWACLITGEACWSSGLPSSLAEFVKGRPSGAGAIFASCSFHAMAFKMRVMEASLTRRLKSTSVVRVRKTSFLILL